MKHRQNFTLDTDILAWLSSKDNQSHFVNEMLRVSMDAEGIDVETLNLQQLKTESEEIKNLIADNQKILNKKFVQISKLEHSQTQKQKELIKQQMKKAQEELNKARCISCGCLIEGKTRFLNYSKGKACLNCVSATPKKDQIKNWGELKK